MVQPVRVLVLFGNVEYDEHVVRGRVLDLVAQRSVRGEPIHHGFWVALDGRHLENRGSARLRAHCYLGHVLERSHI